MPCCQSGASTTVMIGSAAKAELASTISRACGLAAEHHDHGVAAAIAQHRDRAQQPRRTVRVDPQRLRSTGATPGSGGEQHTDRCGRWRRSTPGQAQAGSPIP